MRRVDNRLALADVDRVLAVWTAAARDGRVAGCVAAVEGDNWVQTKDFVHHILQVLTGFQGCEGDVLGVGVGAEVGDDCFAEFGEDFWVSG